MNELQDYSKLYPEMPLEIFVFFSQRETKDGKLIFKEVFNFCDYYHKKYSTKDFPQPRIIANMCDLLTESKLLSVIKRGGIDGMNNSYFCIFNQSEIDNNLSYQFYLNKKLTYIIYGFKFIYEDYKKYVLPIEYSDPLGNKSLGTCFLYTNGIATAKHCIEGADKIAIQGFSGDNLKGAKYEIHENAMMDILFIRFAEPLNETIFFSQNAEVLDEVMTLGYPKIPGYHNFLTAENASVSARYTTSVGRVASNAEDIWMKEKLLLITAKIRGGNSGGPVITKNGSVIGIAVNLTKGDGNYDELGYGTVIPVSFLDDLINSDPKIYLDISKIKFIDPEF